MYSGRTTTKQKAVLTASERKRLRTETVIVAILSLALFYVGATVYAAIDTYGGLAHFMTAINAYGEWLMANPWPFHVGSQILDEFNQNCFIWGLLLAMVPWVVFAFSLQKRGNYDPGKEHGDARWATVEEMEKLIDKELPSNNFMHTQHSGIVNKARNDMIAQWTSAKNKNACYVGASGAGKTARIVKPRVMESLGTMLWPGCKNALGIKDEGFDILVTDPKGDLIYDVGHALVNAQREIKIFNTINPRQSFHYNPLFYIPTRYVDSVKPDNTSWRMYASIDGEETILARKRGKPLNFVEKRGMTQFTFNGMPDMDKYSLRHAPEPQDWICPDCGAENDGNSLVCMNPDCGCKSPSSYPNDVKIIVSPVLHQETTRANNSDLDRVSTSSLGIEAAPNMPSVQDVCAHIEYTTSTVTYLINISNYGADTHTVEFDFVLDPHMTLLDLRCPSHAVKVIQKDRFDAEGRAYVTCECTLRKGALKAPIGAMIEIIAGIDQQDVPDGIALTRTANCLVNNLTDKANKANDDPFWDNAFRLLLMGLIAYLFEIFPMKYRNLRWVMYLLNRAKVDFSGASTSELDQMFDAWETGTIYTDSINEDNPFAVAVGGQFVLCNAQTLEPLDLDDDGTPLSLDGWFGTHDGDNDIALNCYKAFAQGAPETKQSILITAQTAFSKLLNEDMRDLLDYDEMKLDTIGDAGQAQAIFLIGSDTDPSFAFLHALMMYQIINLTCDKALEKYHGALPRHFCIIADEFANTGRLPDVDRTIAVVRSRNISLEIFLQSVQQMSRVYGDEAAEIIKDNCSSYVFLGGQSEKTLEGLEKMAGTETVDMWQLTRSFGGQGSTSENRSAVQRNLITMAQLRQLPDDEAIVQMTGMPPIKDKKINFGGYDFYEWIDPTRSNRGMSKGKRKFEEPFDMARYIADTRAGNTPYDLRPNLIAPPAVWERG